MRNEASDPDLVSRGLTRRRVALAAGAVLFGSLAARGLARAQKGSGIVFFDPGFKAVAEDPERLLKIQRTPIEVGAKQISTCGDFLENKEMQNREEDRRLADYQICFAVEALRRAKQPTRSISECYKAPESCKAAEIIENRLDLRSFPNSLGPRLPTRREPVSLRRLDLPLQTPSPHQLVWEDADWLFRINALAAADFDGSGEEKWLAGLVDRSKTAGYFEAAFLLIAGAGSGGWMTAKVLGAAP